MTTALIRLRRWDLADKLLVLLESVGVIPARIPEIRDALVALLLWKLHKLHAPVGLSRLGLARAATSSSSSSAAAKSLTAAMQLDGGTTSSADSCISNVLGYGESYTCGEQGLVSGQWVPGQVEPCDSLERFVKEAHPILQRVGLFLYQSPKLFTMLCRLLKAHINVVVPSIAQNNNQKLKVTATAPNSSSSSSATKTDPIAAPMSLESISLKNSLEQSFLSSIAPAMEVVANILLPALTVGEANAFLSSQVWDVIEQLPFQVRFRLYDMWRGPGLGKEAIGKKQNETVDAETKALHHARAVLKRLSKDNIKVMGRNVAKYTHNCPMIVYNYVLNQIESFDNMIPIIVDALRYSTLLARDVMAYLLVFQLKKGGAKLKDGDTHYSQWFSSLSRFIATYYKKYPQTELKGLFFYLLNELSEKRSLDLLVLKDVLTIMGGCETLLEVTNDAWFALLS